MAANESGQQHAARAPKARGRGIAVVVLVVLACVLAPIAGTSVWLKNQVTNTDRYVRTVKPLASNSALQTAISDDVTKALFSKVDVQAEAQQALPPRAQFLAGPLTNALRTFTEKATLRFLDSPRFEAIWVNVQRRAHQRLVHVLTGEGKGLETKDGKVVVDLSPIVAQVKQKLASRGVTNFKRLPATSFGASFTLIESKQLANAQQAVKLLKGAAIALPLLVLALLAAAIGLSRRRRRTVLQASLGIAFSMAVLGIGLIVGRSIYLSYVVGPNLPHDAAQAFYDTIVHYLRLGLRAIAGVALLVAAGAFLTGPSRAAVAVRGWFGSGVGRFQGETGVGSTAVGRWVGRNKRPLRVGAILLPVIIFMLWNTPTVTLLIVLVVLALLLLLAIELLGRAPRAPEVGAPTVTP